MKMKEKKFFKTNLKLVAFVIDCENDWHNFVQEQEDFHIDVLFLSIAGREAKMKKIIRLNE